MTEKEKWEHPDKKSCDCPYEREPKDLGWAIKVCPVCGRDVSLEYFILRKRRRKENNL